MSKDSTQYDHLRHARKCHAMYAADLAEFAEALPRVQIFTVHHIMLQARMAKSARQSAALGATAWGTVKQFQDLRRYQRRRRLGHLLYCGFQRTSTVIAL